MMIGDYPCCGGSLWIAMPDNTPGYAPENCPHCGSRVWHMFSRISPENWTEEDFLKQYDVDEQTKSITRRTTRQKGE